MKNPHVSTAIKCGPCGKVKGDTNHWFLTWVDPSPTGEIFMVEPLSSHFPNLAPYMVPVCGQACAHKEMDTWMTELRNAETKEAAQEKLATAI